MKYILFAAILFSNTSFVEAQRNNCKKFHLYGSCMEFTGIDFKYDNQSRSNIIGFGDKLTYRMVFYGERQYKIHFCTSEGFYPIHFKVFDSNSMKLFYDNEKEEYTDKITLNISSTQSLLIEISVLASESSDELKMNFLGCLGMLVEWKPQEKE